MEIYIYTYCVRVYFFTGIMECKYIPFLNQDSTHNMKLQ